MERSTVIESLKSKLRFLPCIMLLIIGVLFVYTQYNSRLKYDWEYEQELKNTFAGQLDQPLEYENEDVNAYLPGNTTFNDFTSSYLLYEDDLFLFENPDPRYSKTFLFISSKVPNDFSTVLFEFAVNGEPVSVLVNNFLGMSTVRIELPESTVESMQLLSVQLQECDITIGPRHKLTDTKDTNGIYKDDNSNIVTNTDVWLRLLNATGVQLDSILVRKGVPVPVSSQVVYYNVVERR